MVFAKVDDIITQTGSDINIDGLAAIAGVTQRAEGYHVTFDIGTDQLRIEGILELDPDVRTLVCARNGTSPSIQIEPTGRLNYGNIMSGRGKERLSGGCGIILTGIDTDSQAEWNMITYGGIYCRGGTLDCFGGTIASSRGFGFYNEAADGQDSSSPAPAVNIRDTRFIKLGTDARREFRFDSPGIPLGTVTGMVLDGFQISHRALPPTIEARIINGQFAQLAHGPTNVTLRNLDTSGNIDTYADLLTDAHNSIVRAYTVINGTAGLRLLPKTGVGVNRQRGYLDHKKHVRFVIQRSDGTPINGAAVFIRDTDHGARKNANGFDDRSDKTYYGVTANGIVEFDVTTAITNIDQDGLTGLNEQDSSGYWNTGLHSGAFRVDNRGLDNDFTARFRAFVWDYGFLPGIPVQSYSDIGDLIITWTLFADPSVTGTAAVAAQKVPLINHTTRRIDTPIAFDLDELYDGIKLNKIPEANIESPAGDILLAAANGRQLDISPYELVAAGDITAGTKFTSLKSTSLIGTSGGAVIHVPVADSRGVSITIQLNIAGARMYGQLRADPTSEINEVADDTGLIRIVVPVDSIIDVLIKADGHVAVRREFDTQERFEFSVDLALDPNLDIGQDITVADDAIVFVYNEGGLSELRFDQVNMSSQIPLSKRVFDRLFSGTAGIQFLFDYNRDGSLNHILEGFPYLILNDRIFINTQVLTFLRKAGLTQAEKSFFGVFVAQEDGTTPYQPPISNNDDVRIDPIANPILLNSVQGEIIVRGVTSDPTYVDAITGGIIAGVSDDLNDIENEISRLDDRLGNDVPLNRIDADGGNEHGVLGIPNRSAIFHLYSTGDTLLEPNVFTLHSRWENIRREEGTTPASFSTRIYALENTAAGELDFVEDFSSRAKYDAFVDAHVDDLIFSQTEADFDPAPEAILVDKPFNRILILNRNNDPVNDTVLFGGARPTMSISNALRQILIRQEQNTENIAEIAASELLAVEGAPVEPITVRESRNVITSAPDSVHFLHGDASTGWAAYMILDMPRDITAQEQALVEMTVGEVMPSTSAPLSDGFHFAVYALQDEDSLTQETDSFANAEAFEIQHRDRRIIHSEDVHPGPVQGVATFPYNRLVIWFRHRHEVVNVNITDIMVEIEGIIPRTLTNTRTILRQTNRLEFDENSHVIASGTGTGGGTVDLTPITNTLSEIEADVTLIRQRIGTTSTTDGTVDVLSRLFIMQDSINQVQAVVAGIPQTAPDLSALSNALQALQISVDAIPTDAPDLTAILDAIADLQDDVDNLPTAGADLSGVTATLTQIRADIAALPTDGDLSVVRADIAAIEAHLTSIQTETDRIDGNVTTLIDRVNTILERSGVERTIDPVAHREDYINAAGDIILAFHLFNAAGEAASDNVTRKVPLSEAEINALNS